MYYLLLDFKSRTLASYHLAQIGTFKFLLDELERQSVNTEKLIRKTNLHLFNLNEPNCYVPASCMYHLYDEIEKSYGIKGFQSEFRNAFYVHNLYTLGGLFLSTHDVMGLLQAGEKYTQLSVTSMSDHLEIQGASSVFTMAFNDTTTAGFESIIVSQIGVFIHFFQSIFGKQWYPLEIRLPLRKVPDLDALLPPGHHSRLVPNQPQLAFVFPTSELRKPLADAIDIPLELLPENFNNLQAKVEKILNACSPGVVPTLEQTADFFESSVRSFQRRLKEEEASYGHLVDQWRFKKAIGMLADPSLKDREISEILGYSNPYNFYRSFKRWTETTPGKYRESLVSNALA